MVLTKRLKDLPEALSLRDHKHVCELFGVKDRDKLPDTMTVEEYKLFLRDGILPKKEKKQKYGNKKVLVDGRRFDSMKEAKYYKELKLWKRSGEVIDFFLQVPYLLPGGITYRMDFVVVWRDHKRGGRVECVDTKGYRTRVYINKKKQVEEIYGIRILEL